MCVRTTQTNRPMYDPTTSSQQKVIPPHSWCSRHIPSVLCRPMMMKPGMTYCPLPHVSLLIKLSWWCLLVTTYPFWHILTIKSIKEWATATGDEARAVLLNVQGDTGHCAGHVEQIAREEFQKWASPFPSFASATVSTLHLALRHCAKRILLNVPWKPWKELSHYKHILQVFTPEQ